MLSNQFTDLEHNLKKVFGIKNWSHKEAIHRDKNKKGVKQKIAAFKKQKLKSEIILPNLMEPYQPRNFRRLPRKNQRTRSANNEETYNDLIYGGAFPIKQTKLLNKFIRRKSCCCVNC